MYALATLAGCILVIGVLVIIFLLEEIRNILRDRK